MGQQLPLVGHLALSRFLWFWLSLPSVQVVSYQVFCLTFTASERWWWSADAATLSPATAQGLEALQAQDLHRGPYPISLCPSLSLSSIPFSLYCVSHMFPPLCCMFGCQVWTHLREPQECLRLSMTVLVYKCQESEQEKWKFLTHKSKQPEKEKQCHSIFCGTWERGGKGGTLCELCSIP